MPPDDTESTPLLPSSASIASSHSSGSSDSDNSSRSSTLGLSPSTTRLAGSFRRPSFVNGSAGRGLLLSSSPVPESALRDDEAFDLIREERGLLERSSVTLLRPTDTDTSTGTSRVRGRRRSSVAQTVQDVDLTWEDAVKMGRVTTSWKYELGVMARYSVWITPPSPPRPCIVLRRVVDCRRRWWLLFVCVWDGVGGNGSTSTESGVSKCLVPGPSRHH